MSSQPLYLYSLVVFFTHSHVCERIKEHTHEDEAACVSANGAITMTNGATDGVHDKLLKNHFLNSMSVYVVENYFI